MVQPTRLDYCQYLLSSPINYTLTHLADQVTKGSVMMINRYLAGERIPPPPWYGKMSNQTLCKQPKDMSSLITVLDSLRSTHWVGASSV